MPCLICGAEKTINAHLIPKAFVMEVKKSRGEKHLLIHKNREGHITSSTGTYDAEILCGPCDGTLGGHEGYVYSLLKELRTNQVAKEGIATIDTIDGNRMVRFAAGIAWKYAVTRPEWGRLSLGPYPPLLAEVAFGSGPIPTSIDVTMIRLVELDGDVYYYRAPLPDRNDGINMVRFCVGSFLFLLKTDKRSNRISIPTECWLRGRSTGSYLIARAERFEEGRLHAQLAGRPHVTKYFRTMRERSDR